jgi:hypothetical protein
MKDECCQTHVVMAAVAKLGSRLNGIEKVEGSSPSGSTFLGAKPPALTAQVALFLAKRVKICHILDSQSVSSDQRYTWEDEPHKEETTRRPATAGFFSF